jgi:hypothetical protein
MPAASNRILAQQTSTAYELRLADLGLALGLLILSGLLFSALFNRETVLSYAIGYNLYGAERVLAGEVPYRDFHTLYPPATVYLNAAIFKLAGVSLYNALLGVMVFKVLTTVVLYLSGRLIMPRGWAVAAALSSLFWLRPNGPFKAVPMHYGALFLAAAMFFLLSYTIRPRRAHLFAAGVSLGVLALLKHNIAGYALIGWVLTGIGLVPRSGRRVEEILNHCRLLFILLLGCSLPVVSVLVYMKLQGALGAMVHTLLFAPGEFLLGRLNALPRPWTALIFAGWMAGCVAMLYWFRARAAAGTLVLTVATASIFIFFVAAPQVAIDPMIFYAPVLVIGAGLAACFYGVAALKKHRTPLLVVLVGGAAAFMESFPRFAREQAVSAMPFVVLLLLYLLYCFKPQVAAIAGGPQRFKIALLIVPLVFVLMGGRLFLNTYFDGLRWKSGVPLRAERGREVRFPEATAKEIDEVIDYVQQRVPIGGYLFAHSYAGSSFLFLAERKNPSGAQFWGGIGVSEEEKGRTLNAIKERDVRLAITSEKDLAAEKYEPMREYLNDNYRFSKRIGDVIILER